MTSDPRHQKQDGEFEKDLEAVHAAWPAAEESEPPELLDRAVLNTARRDLEGHSRRRRIRWLGGFATATVVVLSLGIVIQQEQETFTPPMQESESLELDGSGVGLARKEADQSRAEVKTGREQANGQAPIAGEERSKLEIKRSAIATPPASAPAESAPEPAMSLQLAEPEQEAAIVSAEEKISEDISQASAWVERLLLLQETQQEEKLVQELAAFREAYPDYPLPPELESGFE